TARPVSTAASIAPGRCRARISLIRPAPTAAEPRMTSGVLVSTDTTVSKRARIASTMGTTRSTSSCTLTRAAPGRVDSPPTSISVAPAASICSTRCSAASMRLYRPPSEKESGVMLRIPMTWVRERSSSRSPQGNRELVRVSLMPVSVFAGRTTDKPVITGLIPGVEIVIRGRCRGPRPTTIIVAPALGIAHRLAGHDVVDLLQIDGLVFHQGLGHGIELVTVLFKQALGGAVAIIDDAPHFLVDHACRLGGDVGRLGTLTATQKYLTFLLGVHQRTELLRQTPLGDHVAGQLGGAHDVVGGAGGDAVEAQGHFLGDTAAEQRADLAHQCALGQAVTVFL